MTFKPYVLQNIAPQDVFVLSSIKKVVEAMPNINLGKDEKGIPIDLSCHMLARAIGRWFGLKVRDGLYGGIYDHSWLETESGNVIDVYPVATIGGPILIDGYVARKFYQSSRGRYKGMFSQRSFVKSVNLVKKELAKTMTRIGI